FRLCIEADYINRLLKRLRVLQYWGDVLKQNPLLREIRHIADELLRKDLGHTQHYTFGGKLRGTSMIQSSAASRDTESFIVETSMDRRASETPFGSKGHGWPERRTKQDVALRRPRTERAERGNSRRSRERESTSRR